MKWTQKTSRCSAFWNWNRISGIELGNCRGRQGMLLQDFCSPFVQVCMSQDLSDVLEHPWEPEVEQHTETIWVPSCLQPNCVWQENYNRLNELASLFSHLRDADFSTNVVGLEVVKVETRVFLIKGWRIPVLFHNDTSMLQWCWYRLAGCRFEILMWFAQLKENYSTFTGLCMIFSPCVWLPCRRMSSYSFSEVLFSQTSLKKNF